MNINIGFINNHRGPFQLVVWRDKPHSSKAKVRQDKELLAGEVQADDIEEEVQALMSDRRDTISSIEVWSVREGQHIGTVRK